MPTGIRKQYQRAEVSIDEDAQPRDALELRVNKYSPGGCTLEAFDLSYWVRGRSINSSPKQLLRNVSMNALPGEVLAIMGRSGAGKMRILFYLSKKMVCLM
jgi:ABC-type multidrug transport system ATPase subunit